MKQTASEGSFLVSLCVICKHHKNISRIVHFIVKQKKKLAQTRARAHTHTHTHSIQRQVKTERLRERE